MHHVRQSNQRESSGKEHRLLAVGPDERQIGPKVGETGGVLARPTRQVGSSGRLEL